MSDPEAAWIAIERRALLLRVAVGMAMATVLFYVHVLALAVYGIMVAGFEIARLWRPDRGDPGLAARFLRGSITALQFLPPLALAVMTRGSGEIVVVHYSNYWVRSKIKSLQWLFSGDAMLLGIVMALIVLAALAVAWRRCGTPVAPRILPGLFVLSVAIVVLPQGITTGQTPNWALDWRYLTPAALIAVAAMPDPLRTPGERRGAALLILTLLAAKTTAMTAGPWRVAASDEAALSACLADMPRGGSVASFGLPVDGEGMRWLDMPASPRHIAAFAVAWQEAFVPSLFAFENQQPLRYTPAWKAHAGTFDIIEVYHPAMRDWSPYADVDRLIVLRPDANAHPFAVFGGIPPLSLQVICEGARFVIYEPR